jgi:hypothetical protein
MPYWKNEEQCFLDAEVEGEDRNGKKASGSWPRNIPQVHQEWLKKFKIHTGEFYHQRDKDGNIIREPDPNALFCK